MHILEHSYLLVSICISVGNTPRNGITGSPHEFTLAGAAKGGPPVTRSAQGQSVILDFSGTRGSSLIQHRTKCAMEF